MIQDEFAGIAKDALNRRVDQGQISSLSGSCRLLGP
jgi:hypothetical protein